jgi:[NiFe] hydrogenase assembly HybE family chaperone
MNEATMILEHCLIEGVEKAFRTIHEERMAGLPILNQQLQVQAIGFCQLNGHCAGILITPWFMNLMVLPSEGDSWNDAKPGEKRSFDFPSGPCEMAVVEEKELGRYLSRPLFSPMGSFRNQQQAVLNAESIMQRMMTPIEPTTQEAQPEPGRRALLRGLFSAGQG